MPFWHRAAFAIGVIIAVAIVARIVDHWLASRDLPPEAETRYRVLRRTITVSILLIGISSALLLIPQVRALAGGLLASGAVIGVIIGLA